MSSFHCLISGQVKKLLQPLLILGLASTAGTHVPSDRPNSPVDRGSLAKIATAEHNAERLKLKLRPLEWSPQLALDAGSWAKKLAAENRFEHAYAELSRKKQGENLWMGTAGEFGYPEMIGLWLDERKMAKSGRFPHISKTGKWEDVGHYIQIIWPGTKQVGCAIAANADDEFLVCRYAPAGNIMGEMVNVEGRK